MGSASSEVPSGVFTSNIQNDGLTNTDKLVILVCPLYSEADYVQRVVQLCDQGSIPCIMLNADLINMDQGYGVRARNIRKNLMATFITTYKLKTLSRGAVVREWPNRFTVWKEDQSAEGGYVSLQSVASDPSREELDEMFDVSTHDSDLLVCLPLASIHPSIQLLYNPSCRQRTTLRQRVREAMLWVR
jgi:hypothetical protein